MPAAPASDADPSGWEVRFAADLARLEVAGLRRSHRAVKIIDATHVAIDGRPLVNFASNNYLGLTHHPRVREAVTVAVRGHGWGSAAAGLVTGFSDAHRAAAAAIATWKNTAAAVLLPSGYQANLGAIQTLAAVGREAGGVRFLLDKLCHASLIDAVRAAAATGDDAVTFRVFPHHHLAKLARLLAAAPAGQQQIVVTESIFSMEGDAADLAGLASLRRQYPFFLLVDEAHGTGVYGRGGAGLANELGVAESVDAFIVTLSKAMGGSGGAVCGSQGFCDAVLNHGRAYIYSTAVPPAIAAGAMAAIAVMRDEPGRAARVRQAARQLRARLIAAGLAVAAGDSPIVPVVLSDEQAALAAARRLEDAGLLVVAMRPPTVPRGSSRLRVTLSSEHTDAEIDRLADEITRLAINARPQGYVQEAR